MGHPSTRFVRIVFDDEEAARHRHPTFAPADECRLIVDVVQRVGHENAIQVGEWPREVREVTAMRCDADTLMPGRDPSKNRAVSVHRVDDAARWEQVRKREGERSSATTKIGPLRRPKRVDITLRKHFDRIAQTHRWIVPHAKIADLWISVGCGCTVGVTPNVAPEKSSLARNNPDWSSDDL